MSYDPQSLYPLLRDLFLDEKWIDLQVRFDNRGISPLQALYRSELVFSIPCDYGVPKILNWKILKSRCAPSEDPFKILTDPNYDLTANYKRNEIMVFVGRRKGMTKIKSTPQLPFSLEAQTISSQLNEPTCISSPGVKF